MFSKRFKLVQISIFAVTISINNYVFSSSSFERNSNNEIVLNQGSDSKISAHNSKNSDGSKKFQSKYNISGVKITEEISEGGSNNLVQENKLVVSVAKNKSVEFIQKFNTNGTKTSKVITKQPRRYDDKATKNIVATQGTDDDMSIEHKVSFTNDGRKQTETTVEKGDFIYFTGIKKWKVSASGGYVKYKDAVDSDGSTGAARLSLGRDFFVVKSANIGLEAAIQNGVEMRPIVDESELDFLGGVPIQGTVKPVIELLATISKSFYFNRLSWFVKLGAARRVMTFDRQTISNIKEISPDLHFGLGKAISENLDLTLYYNIIWGGNPDIKSTKFDFPVNNTGKAKDIPKQQGGFIGVNYGF